MNAVEMKAAIEAVNDLKPKPCAVPEWGVEGFLQVMTALDRADWERRTFLDEKGESSKTRPDSWRAAVVAKCFVDAGGVRVFGDTPEDLALLMGKSSAVIERLYDQAAALNGLRPGDQEEAEKNSAGGTAATSPSA